MALRIYLAVSILILFAFWSLPTVGALHAQATQGAILDAPSVTAVGRATEIEVTWTLVSGAVKYEIWVWLDRATGWRRLDSGDLTALSYTHSGLTAGRVYYFVVAAIDSANVRGEWSNQVSVTLPTATQTLSAPTVSTSTSGADSIVVSWNAVTGAAKYELWAWQNSEVGWQRLDDGGLTGTQYSHSQLSSGITYYYTIAGLDAQSKRGAWSTVVSATVPGTPNPLDTPSLTATSQISATVELSWTEVPNASRYLLYTWWDPSLGWQKIDDGNLTATQYVHDGVTPGLTYYFTAAALKADGVLASWSQSASVTVSDSPPKLDVSNERAALVALYDATDGPNWGQATNWLSDASIADWHGVVTNEDGRVIELVLASNGLQGTIPSLSDLTELQILSLGSNKLSGSIPDLSQFTNLVALDLDSNQLTGSIPSLDATTTLEWLSLSNNELSGQIPSLSSLTKLTVLDFSNNQLTGTIPAVNTLSQLGSFSLSGNELSGSIPSLDALTEVTDLHLGSNKLSGTIPNLSTLTDLRLLSLSGNNLSGEIPQLSNLTNLTALELGNNQLTGSVPDLSALTSLKQLNLGHNQLTGGLPDLSNLVNLSELTLSNNLFSGSVTNVESLSNLKWLDLSNNRLTGRPPATGSLTQLERLDLNHNQLSGTIPDLSALTNLVYLDFGSNTLTGTVPDLSSLTSLTSLVLASNQLSGPVPVISALTHLTVLDLSANQLCLPAGYDLASLDADIAAHITGLNLPSCATGRVSGKLEA